MGETTIYRKIGGYVKRAKLNLRNEKDTVRCRS